jgi:hypothetical protein
LESQAVLDPELSTDTENNTAKSDKNIGGDDINGIEEESSSVNDSSDSEVGGTQNGKYSISLKCIKLFILIVKIYFFIIISF